MRVLLLGSIVAFALACGSSNTGQQPIPVADSGTPDDQPKTSAFIVGNWNLEWFGSATDGPTDEALQQANIAKVMKTLDADIWSVQEVVDTAALTKVASAVGDDYRALNANDPSVAGGPEEYANPAKHKLGFLYRSSRVDVKGARCILLDQDTLFNWRAPLEIDLETKPGKAALTVIVVHLAQGVDAPSYDKRKQSAAALKAYLDKKPAGSLVMVAGDFNDGLDKSETPSQPTPYAIFLDDKAYAFTTKDLQSPRYPQVIDHQLVTDDLLAAYTDGSARVTNGDTLITNYVKTTSDHDPVTVRYDLP
jgi:endonuclease/exonuclease/phosphatase family metal-dependent hydrolase